MEDTFGINNVALVDGQPRVLGLRDLLRIYIDHRINVVRRRTEFRRTQAPDRLHLVDGLIIALLNIDEVIAVIRSSDDAAAARERLMSIFELSQIQAQYILDTPLRRLTKYDKLELEREQHNPYRRDRRAHRDPGVRAEAARAGLLRTGRRRREVRHPAPDGAARSQRCCQDRRGPAGGDRRSLYGPAVLSRPAGQDCRSQASRPAGAGREKIQ